MLIDFSLSHHAGQPVALIVAYARQHAVDQILLCARGGHSAGRRRHVSVSVSQEAPCSVTVVRARHGLTEHRAPKRVRRA